MFKLITKFLTQLNFSSINCIRIYHVRFMSHDRQWPRSPTDEMIILSNYQQPQLSPASAHSLIESFVAIETANKRWYQYLASLGLLILTHQENVVRWQKRTFAHISHVNKQRHTTNTTMKICGKRQNFIRNSFYSISHCAGPLVLDTRENL